MYPFWKFETVVKLNRKLPIVK
uniref:Uncharacterized protein n=1 Tax=Arundo donax TaxID=35708 RepID=A0A0A9B484_ARUDO